MIRSFGPWATAANIGSNVRLSTFWKSRLAMLPATYRSNAELGRRASLLLLISAILLWTLPRLYGEFVASSKAADESGDVRPSPARCWIRGGT
jgi:hypothetical protein